LLDLNNIDIRHRKRETNKQTYRNTDKQFEIQTETDIRTVSI